jgi:hypothetical protein
VFVCIKLYGIHVVGKLMISESALRCQAPLLKSMVSILEFKYSNGSLPAVGAAKVGSDEAFNVGEVASWDFFSNFLATLFPDVASICKSLKCLGVICAHDPLVVSPDTGPLWSVVELCFLACCAFVFALLRSICCALAGHPIGPSIYGFDASEWRFLGYGDDSRPLFGVKF